jgi:hypothetical protein
VNVTGINRALRTNAGALLFALAGCTMTVWLGLREMLSGGDYETEVRPSFDALAQGHVTSFLRLVPAYGGSLIERAPFVLIPGLWGGGQDAVYRAVALPCLIAGVALGLWLLAQARSQGRSAPVKAVVLGLCVINPIVIRALELGHPEELLGAVLCVWAVLLAQRGRAAWAGIVLGLAVANKEWALLAVGPALLALPSRRTLLLLCAGGTAAAVLAPLVLVGGGGFVAGARASAAPAQLIFLPMQVFWLAGEIDGSGGFLEVVRTVSHPLIILLALPLTALAWHRRAPGAGRPADALLLLALLLLLRCMLDTWDNVYYPLPFVIAVLVWETCSLRRAPLLALAATVLVWINGSLSLHGYTQAAALLFLAWSLPMAVWLAAGLYGPRRRRASAQGTTVSSLASRVKISAPSSLTATRSSIRTPQLPGR